MKRNTGRDVGVAVPGQTGSGGPAPIAAELCEDGEDQQPPGW